MKWKRSFTGHEVSCGYPFVRLKYGEAGIIDDERIDGRSLSVAIAAQLCVAMANVIFVTSTLLKLF
jgi:hypothetical protein